MRLRPHHVLCIGFFEGKGYSTSFTAHMTEVIAQLSAGDPAVTLTCACDEICTACPHRSNDVCDTAGKVLQFDRAVLQYCALQDGQTLHWSELRKMAQRCAVPHLQEICGTCQWYTVCGKQ